MYIRAVHIYIYTEESAGARVHVCIPAYLNHENIYIYICIHTYIRTYTRMLNICIYVYIHTQYTHIITRHIQTLLECMEIYTQSTIAPKSYGGSGVLGPRYSRKGPRGRFGIGSEAAGEGLPPCLLDRSLGVHVFPTGWRDPSPPVPEYLQQNVLNTLFFSDSSIGPEGLDCEPTELRKGRSPGSMRCTRASGNSRWP